MGVLQPLVTQLNITLSFIIILYTHIYVNALYIYTFLNADPYFTITTISYMLDVHLKMII
jgi:hypothetical protein